MGEKNRNSHVSMQENIKNIKVSKIRPVQHKQRGEKKQNFAMFTTRTHVLLDTNVLLQLKELEDVCVPGLQVNGECSRAL